MMMIKGLLLSCLCLFFIVSSAAAALAADDDDDPHYKDRLQEVHIKNEIPGQEDPRLDVVSSGLGIYCSSVDDDILGFQRILGVHQELLLRYSVTEPMKCRCYWGGLSQDLVVSGTGTPCHQPGAVCKWEVRVDGFYFLTAAAGWKKMHSWEEN